MSKKNKKLEEDLFPTIEFEDYDKNEELNVGGDGIETLEGGLENYQQNQEQEEDYDLTFDEKKKYLRAMGKKNLTDHQIDNLSEEEIEEIKEFIKLKDKKTVYKFVTRKKTVTDEEVKNLTDEEFEKLVTKSLVMSRHFSYNPKKHYGVKYKKKRQNKNKQAKASRKLNRK